MKRNTDRCNKERGHIRSASLENAISFIAKNTLGLPIVQANATGTFKTRNEQTNLLNKFGSHNNLEDYIAPTRSKFQNIRQMFEDNKMDTSVQISQQHNSEAYTQQTSPIYSLTMHQATKTAHDPFELNNRLNIVESKSESDRRCHETSDSINYERNTDQAKNVIRPITFKPIPFEPDYSIPHRYIETCDRYGSTPSLVPVQGSGLRFGSTSDLRHGISILANNHNNQQLARRRCSRSMKMNGSLDSDSDATSSQSKSSTKKSINVNLSRSNNLYYNNNNKNFNKSSNNNKYMSNDQFDITPSPSDSGISELEAALKDRDSELSYLRQTMEHNEKVIFKVQKDKEEYWENETKRLKAFYENQQRDYMMKIKKLEQLLSLQSFQFKQNKLRFTESSNRLKDQFTDLKRENEMLRSTNDNLKTSDRTMKECVEQLEDKLHTMHNLVTNLRNQLEENKWTVCQKNGEIALLKTQLKEANMELTIKEQEILQMKHDNNSDSLMYQSIKNSNNSSDHSIPNEQTTSNEIEFNQLNKIIILKDQVILALTNELGKLRKELSDLAIFQEYGEESSGKLTRLKYQIENLSNIWNATKKSSDSENLQQNKVIDDDNLELIINCLKLSSTAVATNQKNDVVVYQNHNIEPHLSVKVFQPSSSGTTVESTESSKNTDEIETLRNQLNKVRADFEIERQQWVEEKEKVLNYQRQLQMHYINMYQKMISLNHC